MKAEVTSAGAGHGQASAEDRSDAMKILKAYAAGGLFDSALEE